MGRDLDIERIVFFCAALGLVVGVVAAVPILMVPNLCCVWIMAGGFIAAFLSTHRMKSPEVVDGAIVGAVFGFFYGFINGISIQIVKTVLNLFGIGLAARGQTVGGVSSIMNFHIGGILWGLLLFVLNIALGVLFGAAGGLLCTAILRQIEGSHSGQRRPAGTTKLREI